MQGGVGGIEASGANGILVVEALNCGARQALEVVAQLSTGTPGMALYAKFGGPAEPDDFEAQASPVGTTGLELTSDTSGVGEWHFLVVHEGPDAQGFTLTVQTNKPTDDDFEIVKVPNGMRVTRDFGPHEMRAFYMDVPPGQTVMHSRLQGSEGDAESGSIAMYGARERLATSHSRASPVRVFYPSFSGGRRNGDTLSTAATEWLISLVLMLGSVPLIPETPQAQREV